VLELDQGKLIRADLPVASKLKCPVLLASEMAGLDWECGKVRLLFGLTHKKAAKKWGLTDSGGSITL